MKFSHETEPNFSRPSLKYIKNKIAEPYLLPKNFTSEWVHVHVCIVYFSSAPLFENENSR